MNITNTLISGTLIKRYKRFLADIELENGMIVTAHCPNSGSMKSCNVPGSRVLLSLNDSVKRKLKYTWEMVYINNTWVGINTHYTNKLAAEAIQNGMIRELREYDHLRHEVRLGQNSRIDLFLTSVKGKCFVEVKNVTMIDRKAAMFPDAVTVRGRKHLEELSNMVQLGHRGVILFVVQRNDATVFKPADHIDPEFGSSLRTAVKHGVEAICYKASVSPEKIEVVKRLPVVL